MQKHPHSDALYLRKSLGTCCNRNFHIFRMFSTGISAMNFKTQKMLMEENMKEKIRNWFRDNKNINTYTWNEINGGGVGAT